MNALTEWKITTKATLVAALIASAVAAGLAASGGGTQLAQPTAAEAEAPAPEVTTEAAPAATVNEPTAEVAQPATVVERVELVETRVDGIDTRLRAVETATTTTSPTAPTATPAAPSSPTVPTTISPQPVVIERDPTPEATVPTTAPTTTTTTIPAFSCTAAQNSLTVRVATNKPGVPITLAWQSYHDLGDGSPQDGTTSADTAADGSYSIRVPERYRSSMTTAGPLGQVTVSSDSGGTCTVSW